MIDSESRNKITNNFLSLFGVQLVQNLASLVTVPYLARVLGVRVLGLIVVTQAFRMFAWPVVEYGFSYSATRDIARLGNGLDDQAEIVASVFSASIWLSIPVIVAGAALMVLYPAFADQPQYMVFGTISAIATGVSPWWYFQGAEALRLPAVFAIATRLTATALVFILVRSPGDGWIVVALDAMAVTATASLLIAALLRRIGKVRLNFGASLNTLKAGLRLALPRIGERWQEASGPMLVGILLGPTSAGFYGGADKVVKIWRTAVQSFLRAVYPRVCALLIEDEQVAQKTRRILSRAGLGVSLAAAIITILLASVVIRIFLGPDFGSSIPLLKVLAITMPLVYVSGTLGILSILPIGGDRQFKNITLTTLAIQVAFILVGARMGGAQGVAVGVVAAEILRFFLLRRATLDSILK